MDTATADPVDALVPEYTERTITIGKDEYEMTFTQKPLSFFQKMEFFSVMGRAIDRAMSGPEGISINDLLSLPERGETLSADDFKDADVFIRAIAKLVTEAPEILEDLYVVILGVPRTHRDFAKRLMSGPADEGGLTDEDGIAILETFIDQNWDVMVDFFGERIKPLVEKVTGKVQSSQPSKPSKGTRRRTQKQ